MSKTYRAMWYPPKSLVKMYGSVPIEERSVCVHVRAAGWCVAETWIDGNTPGWKRFCKRMKRKAQRRVDRELCVTTS